jgi:acetyl-CoA synthetase
VCGVSGVDKRRHGRVRIASHRHQPLGVVHPTAGLLVAAAEMHRRALILGPDDVLWTAMELSFVNGLVQGIVGPLACGMRAVLFEGTLDTPTQARAWEIIERYRVSTLCTTPSVVRHLHRWTQGSPPQDLSSLRLVVTGGEHLDEDDAAWLRTGLKPPGGLTVVNAWGQTETGGVDVVDGEGHTAATGTAGEMVLRNPWPGLFCQVEGHPDPAGRYWRTWPDGDTAYATGDLVIRQPGGQLEFLRRLDSVVKVSGQLVSLDDISEAILEHPFVEKGLATQTLGPGGDRILLACVTLTADVSPSPKLADDVRRHVHESLGGLARLGAVAFVEAFPHGVSTVDLRYALALVGAARSPASSFEVTAVQLKEALGATRGL